MNRHDEALLKKLQDTVNTQGTDSIPRRTLYSLFEHKGLEIKQWILDTYDPEFIPQEILDNILRYIWYKNY